MGLVLAVLFAFVAVNSEADGKSVKIPKHDQPGQYHVIPANK